MPHFYSKRRGLKIKMLCFTITIFRKFQYYEGKSRCPPRSGEDEDILIRNSIEEEEEEEDEVFPRVGVAPSVSSLPGKTTPTRSSRYIEFLWN